MPGKNLTLRPSCFRTNLARVSQLTEQYGVEVATDLMNRSKSTLNLDSLSTMPYTSAPPGYSSSTTLNRSVGHAHYQSVGGTIQDEHGKKL